MIHKVKQPRIDGANVSLILGHFQKCLTLLNQVWGSDFLGETRTIDVHIGQLRKKLGLSEVIKTIPKIGYRLEDG